MKSVRGNTFFYGKLSAFDIYFSKNTHMLKITSERGKIFQIVVSYSSKMYAHVKCCLFLVFYYYMLKSKEKILLKTEVIVGT